MSNAHLRVLRLTNTEGRSNKEYNIYITIGEGGVCHVRVEYGAIGKALKREYKSQEPLTANQAIRLYEKTKNEKLRKGYVVDRETIFDDAEPSEPLKPLPQKVATGLLPMLLNPIERADISHYQHNANWCFQIKYDGERQIIKITEAGIVLANRTGTEIPAPDSVIALRDALAGVGITTAVLDCERMTDSQFVVFDVLQINADNLINVDMFKRLIRLNSLSPVFNACLSGKEFVVTKVAFSTEEKHQLLKQAEADNEEGIVIKRMDATYTPSRPASLGDALKLKFYDTATVRVESHHKTKSSVGIELRDASGVFVNVGNVTIPPNAQKPAIGQLIEVRYLYAYLKGSLYQPTYIRERNDLVESAATLDQLKYKKTDIAA